MKNLLSIFLFTALSFFITTKIEAQNRVLVTNTPEGSSVKLKWVTPEVYTKEDVIVYRKQGRGSWELLTPSPIGIKDEINKPATEKDDLDNMFESELHKKDPAQNDGLMKLIIASRLIMDEAFADFLGVFYEDKTVEPGKTYQYKVVIKNASNEKDLAVSESIKVRKHKPIPAVKDFNIMTEEISDTLLRFVWTPETARYFAANIYRKGENGDFKKINTTPIVPAGKKGDYANQFFQDGNQKAGRKYTFEIRPIDFFGREGQGKTKTITMPDRGLPIPVVVTQMDRLNGNTFQIIWAESETPNVQGYEVHIGRNIEGPYKKVNKKLIPPGSGYFNYKVDESGSYFAKVVTVSANKMKSASYAYAVEMNDLEPPLVPQGVSAKAESGKILISWKANKEADLLGYRVYRTIAAQPDKLAALITPQEIKGTSFSDKLNKRYKNEFFYTVVAVDTSLNLSEASNRVGAVMPDVIPPIQPFIKNIKANANSVQIEWLPGTDEDLAYFQLSRSSENESDWIVIGGNLSTTSVDYKDENMVTGQKYFYRLQAFDLDGNASEFSETYAAKPWEIAIENGTKSFDLSYDKNNQSVKISWKPQSEKNIVGAIVLRSSTSKAMAPVSPMIKGFSYTDSKTKLDERYQYTVKIYYENGGIVQSETKEINTQ